MTDLLAVTAVLLLLLLADRWLHRHLQGVMYLLSGDEEVALWLYALILFPGVLLHELSHALMAALLGVRIGRISVLPKRVGDHIHLGFVPVEETDFVRSSLIGAAPLLSGTAAILLIGIHLFGTPTLVAAMEAGRWAEAAEALRGAFHAPDAWLWFYLIFAIGHTMLPSRADIHAWPFLGALLLAAMGIVVAAGAGAVLFEGLRALMTALAAWMVLLGGSLLLADLPLFSFLAALEWLLGRLTGKRVRYAK